MDKSRHPIVVRPWKTRQSQPMKENLPPAKADKERRVRDSKWSRVLTLKKIREQGSGKSG